MANRFLSNIRINDAYTFPASDGSNGQVIITDGSGNLTFADPSTSSSASVIYRDNFTGDGSTVAFTLQNSLSDEDQTFIYIDGVYQEKDNYSLSDKTITFTTAPESGHSVEVISISGINVGPTTIYQDNFTGDGLATEFNMAQSVDNEVKTMIYFNGVYQFKGTYTVNGSLITFDTAPANGVAIEVISIASAAAGEEAYSQELLFYGKASEAISKGDAVMFAGSQGDHFLFAKATQAAIEANHEYLIGLATQDLATNEYGYVTEFGSIVAIDTDAYEQGDILWFDAGGTTAGALTTTEPAAPLAKIQVAAVIRKHQNEGVLFVRPTWFHALNELHDVNITSIADKDILAWNNTQGYWENTKTLDSLTANTLSATTLTGTLSTAAQENITSVGTLSTLNISGNVGIGINTPNAKLHTKTSGTFTFDSNDQDFSGVNIILGTDNTGLNQVTNGIVWTKGGSDTRKLAAITNYVYGDGDQMGLNFYVQPSTSGSAASLVEAMRIDNSGNVGIGVSPSVKLDVDGSVYVRTGGTLFVDTIAAYTSGNITLNSSTNFIIPSGDLNIGVTSALLPSPGRGNLSINGNSDSVVTLGVGGVWSSYYYTNGSATYLSSKSGTPLHFEAGGTTKLTISSDGDVGIGIGTNLPSSRLTVNYTLDGDGLEIKNSNRGGSYQLATSGVSAQRFAITDTTNSVTNAIFGYDRVTLYTGTSTSVDARLYIDASGNIGLGTTSPGNYNGTASTKVLAVGDTSGNNGVNIVSGTTSTGSYMFSDSGGNDRGGITYYHTADLMTITTGGSEAVRILSDGNFGIGTTSPSQNLHISSNVSTGLLLESTYSTTGKQWLINSRGADSSFQIYNETDSVDALRILSNGNVGIGNTSPYFKLDVAGGIRATGEAISTAGAILGMYSGGTNLSSSELILGSTAKTGWGPTDELGTIRWYNIDGSGIGARDAAKISAFCDVGNGSSTTTFSGALAFYTSLYNDTVQERMRITSGGFLKASNDGAYVSAGSSYHELLSNANGNVLQFARHKGTNPYGIQINFSGAAPDNNSNYFLRGTDSAANRFYIYSDGDVWTSDAGTLTSDETLKRNITDATPKLDDVMSLKVRNYYWNEDYHPNKVDKKLIGFIAQEFEQVFPHLVSEHKVIDEEVAEDGTVIKEAVYKKGIKEGKLIPILVKAMQEQQAIIEDLKTRIQTLENNG